MPGVGLGQTTSSPLLPGSMCFFLYALSCEKALMLVFRAFSGMIALYVVVVLVCPQRRQAQGLSTPPSCLPLLTRVAFTLSVFSGVLLYYALLNAFTIKP